MSGKRVKVVIVSGGMGEAPEQILNTVLVQFPDPRVDVEKHTLVRDAAEIERALNSAAESGGVVIHALVHPGLRAHLEGRAAALGVPNVDAFGSLIGLLAERLEQEPMASPGRYREMRRDYFRRIEAIEFTIQHDDSQATDSLAEADIVLVGVSRTGKTPLSIYLAMQGWRVANVSFVPGIELPTALESVDRRRVVGLVIDHEELLAHRRRRHADFGIRRATPYVSSQEVFEELEALLEGFRRRRIPVVETTQKPLESIAHEVVDIVTRRLGDDAQRD